MMEFDVNVDPPEPKLPVDFCQRCATEIPRRTHRPYRWCLFCANFLLDSRIPRELHPKSAYPFEDTQPVLMEVPLG
jgi:hypothetical protein